MFDGVFGAAQAAALTVLAWPPGHKPMHSTCCSETNMQVYLQLAGRCLLGAAPLAVFCQQRRLSVH